MNSTKKNIRNIVIVAVLMITAYVCKTVIFSAEDMFLAALLKIVRNVIHISIVAVWTVSIYMRVVSKQIRNMLIAVGVLMVAWLVVRTCKWEFIYTTDTLTRYLWYAFYIPMILIPLFGVFITMHIGKPDNYTLPSRHKLFFIPAAVVILLVFTNDWHRLVFDFPDGIYYFDDSYTHNVLFFIPAGWFTVLGFYFGLKLFLKSRVPGSRSFQKMHIVIFGGAVVFWIIYALGLIDADLTAVDCTLITLLLESAIQSGLIRTNTNYKTLFEISSVTAQIVDSDFNSVVRSSQAEDFTKDVMRNASAAPQNLGDYILNCDTITGGFVYWQDDIKHISELIEAMQETQTQLSENNFLLQAELELKENQAKTEEQSRLFSRLIFEISPQLERAKEIIAQASEDKKNRKMLLARLSVIGAYIKRRGNLFIISEDKNNISSREIELCINESLSNLQLLGIDTSFVFSLPEEISVASALKLYDVFEYFTEKLTDETQAVLVKISPSGDDISLRMMIGAEYSDISVDTESTVLNGTLTRIDCSDGDIVIDVLVKKEET